MLNDHRYERCSDRIGVVRLLPGYTKYTQHREVSSSVSIKARRGAEEVCRYGLSDHRRWLWLMPLTTVVMLRSFVSHYQRRPPRLVSSPFFFLRTTLHVHSTPSSYIVAASSKPTAGRRRPIFGAGRLHVFIITTKQQADRAHHFMD